VAAVVAAAAAVSFAAGGSAFPFAAKESDHSVTGEAAPCCVKATGVAPAVVKQSGMRVIAAQRVMTSRTRTVEVPRVLPTGVAPERGLQVRTILAARSISMEFPDIHEIGGVRPDAMRWHPNGLALDVMIPNPGTGEGVALGNEIVDFALRNAGQFGLQDAIWRGVYYTPNGPRGAGYGHFDHVHITTNGGGFPTGREVYLR
jgi:hypothetical protein